MTSLSYNIADRTKPKRTFRWKNKLILIIEDDYVNFLYLRDILMPAQARLIRYVSLNDALEQLISEANFDLIIMNSNMEGNEACQGISRIKSLKPGVPLLAFSGHDCKNRGQKCAFSGCDVFISLHMDSHEILLTVDELLNKGI